MDQQNYKWHQSSVDAILQKLNTDAACGLSHKAARSRYRKNGANTLFDVPGEANVQYWLSFFKDPSLIFFLCVVLLAIFFSEIAVALTALGFFLIGILFLWLIWNRNKKDEKKIGSFRVPSVTVIREGKPFTVSARRVVVGDILLLKCGDIVPCDCRLLETRELKVLTLLPNQNGEAVWKTYPKSADMTYPYGSSIFAPFCENMVYGGSQISQGQALAVATEIGEHTFLGAMHTFSIPAEEKTKSRTLTGVQKWLRVYSLIQYFFLIPLALLGVFLAPKDQNVLYILLSMSALLVTGSQSFLSLLFQTVVLHSKHNCLYLMSEENKTVLKSDGAAEKLSGITDLIVLGHGTISDSKKHLFRCATGNGIASLKEDSDFALQSLCEALLIRHRAQKSTGILQESESSGLFVQELLQYSRFDEEALDVRLLNAEIFSESGQTQTISVKTKESSFFLYFSENPRLLDRCEGYDDCGTTRVFSVEQKYALKKFSLSAEADGGQVLFVGKQIGTRLIFLGILAIREEIQSILPSVLEEYRQSNVRVSFFLSGDPSVESRYARAAKLSSTICQKDSLQSEPLRDSFESNRVFLNFSKQEILGLIQTLRKQGRIVAVVGESFEEIQLLQAANVSIGCTVTLGTGDHDLDFSQKESSVVRRNADLLIPRASRFGGGLSALLQTLAECRSTQQKGESVFRFLFFSQILRLLLLVLGICSGIGILSGVLLMQLGWIGEIGAVCWLLSLSIPQKRLRKCRLFLYNNMREQILSRNTWISILGSGFVFLVLTVLLRALDFWSIKDGIAFLFNSLLLSQLLALYWTAKQSCGAISRKKLAIPLASIAILMGINCLVAFLFPNFALSIGLILVSKKSLAFVPVVPLAFWLLLFLFLKKKNRTAK